MVRSEGERDVVAKMYLLSAVYCTSHTEASLKYITSRTNTHWRTGERQTDRQRETDRQTEIDTEREMVKIHLFEQCTVLVTQNPHLDTTPLG